MKNKNKFSVYFFILILQVLLVTNSYAALKICSFNCRSMKPKDVELSVEFIKKEKIDIIALQECYGNDVQTLCLKLGNSEWDYVQSESASHSTSEKLAFLWKKKSVQLYETPREITDRTIEGEPFARHPYVAVFKNENYKLALINIHIFFGDNNSNERRKLEIQALEQIYVSVNKSSIFDKSWHTIILGDFNLNCEQINKSLINNAFRPYQCDNTTVSSNGNSLINSYDHFAMSDKTFEKLEPRIYSLNLIEKYYPHGYYTDISDHIPIVMEFGSKSLFEKIFKSFF